jgi:hypothetical protein
MDTPTATKTNAPPPQMKLPSGMAGRIPLSLQAIFLASNQGAAVHDAPPNKIASMEFVRSTPFPFGSNKSCHKSSSFTLTKKRIPTKLALLKPVERNKTMVRNW